MFFTILNGARSEQWNVATTEELGMRLRHSMKKDRFDSIWVSVGTEAACMPYAQLYKKNHRWRCSNEGDCIRLGFFPDELPEDRDPMWTALERGDVVLHEPRGDVLDTERIGDLHQESKRLAGLLMKRAKAK